ncbi:MAG: AraC family transcriptional regulator [Planctomycetes bacterium]|nr:AraC family transcriptional regulator [Planctomycetota bacterium]
MTKTAPRRDRILKVASPLPAPPLRLINGGSIRTGPGFAIGPRRIPEYGIGFLDEGRGWMVQAGRRCLLTRGDLFIVFPETSYAFAADEHHPWDVYHLNFTCAGLAPILRRAGLTSTSYLCTGIDRVEMRGWFDDLLAVAERSAGADVIGITAAAWTILRGMTRAAPITSPGTRAGRFVAARRHLDQRLAESVPIADLAERAGCSRFHFMRAFQREVGMSPRQYQIHARIAAAKKLLADGLSVKETAYRLGYGDLFYFSRLFKQKAGVAPSTFGKRRFLS